MENTYESKNRYDVTFYNKIVYSLLLGLGLYFFILKEDYSNATIYFGLALVFDPFDYQVHYYKRPLYQQLWPIAHIVVEVVFFVLMLTTK